MSEYFSSTRTSGEVPSHNVWPEGSGSEAADSDLRDLYRARATSARQPQVRQPLRIQHRITMDTINFPLLLQLEDNVYESQQSI